MSVPSLLRAVQRLTVVLLAVVGAGFVVLLLWPLPAPLKDLSVPSSQQFLDRNGQVLYTVPTNEGLSSGQLNLNEIPPVCVQSLLATEDRSFYSHPGVSLRGVVRAAVQDLTTGQVISGGSTITQQLVRIRLHPANRSFAWKVQEMIWAVKLELHATKAEILSAYLSGSYFGHQAVGLQSAAHVYLGKSLKELSPGECALLIGLLQSPTRFDPYNHEGAALERRKTVINALYATHVISEKEKDQTLTEPVRLSHGLSQIHAPHFVLWLRDDKAEEISGEKTIRTTLDANLQNALEDIVTRKLEELKEKHVGSAAVVVLDAHNGDILGMVGSGDFFADEAGAFNAALAARQPGSTMKPFTYALAFAQGDTAATTVADTSVQFLTAEGTPYTPRNYDYEEHGLVRYRESLANSYNIAAVKVLERVGVEKLLSFMRSLGISTLTEGPDHYGLALTLGDAEVRLLELTQAYGAFARGGQTLQPRALLSQPVQTGAPALSANVAWLISDILSDEQARLAEFGENTPLSFDFPVAAKTGTTRNSRDNWVIGYTPDRVVGVWVGNPDNTPMRGTSGITGAGPIFHDAMVAAMTGISPSEFIPPSNVVVREICALSGKLPTNACRETVPEVFLPGTEPKAIDDIWQSVRLDTRNNLKASEGCDEKFVRTETFAHFPLELQKWAREAGYKQQPVQFSPFCPPERGSMEDSPEHAPSAVSITSPHDGDRFLRDPIIRNRDEQITFTAETEKPQDTVHWFVDNVSVGEGQGAGHRLDWPMTLGQHTVEARLDSGNRDSLRITVMNP